MPFDPTTPTESYKRGALRHLGWPHHSTLADNPTCAFYLFIRVMEITDILSQNVPLEDVQYLAGHSNPQGHTDL